MDEVFLQLLRHLSIHRQSVRAWELLMLALSTAVPSASCTDTVSSFVHSAAKTKGQWPTAASILAKRSKGALLKLLSQPHRRRHVSHCPHPQSPVQSSTPFAGVASLSKLMHKQRLPVLGGIACGCYK